MADEYISREALLQDISDTVRFTVKSGEPSAEMRGANKIIDRIRSAPAADVVERKRGEWIRICEDDLESRVQCSACLQDFDYIDGVCYLVSGYELPLYCPNCGADMRKEQTNGL